MKATPPVGAGFPAGPVTVAVNVELWPGNGSAKLEVNTTAGVSLLDKAMTVPPLEELPSQFVSQP
jgi:hypothetical protein